METMYEARSADIVSEMIAFRATAEPMLMSEIATPEPNETQIAFKGIFQPGLTY